MIQQKILSLLFEHTATLKNEFIEKTAIWAAADYSRITERITWGIDKWCEFFSIKPEQQYGCWSFPKGFYNTRTAKEYRNMQAQITEIKRLSHDEYVSEAIKSAEDHYETSIQKLAYRIENKGLNMDNLKIITAHVGVNIETVITDGNETVRCFTIRAWGQVIRPHYRYIIK